MKFLTLILALAKSFFETFFHRLFKAASFAVAVFFFLPLGLAFAQAEASVGGLDDLQQCVDFFVKGSPFEWIVGGLFLVATVLGLFFRSSILSIIVDLTRKIGASKK